jgi:hypothetical protein
MDYRRRPTDVPAEKTRHNTASLTTIPQRVFIEGATAEGVVS